MTAIVDKRKNGKNSSAINRGRFLERHKYRIREAIHESINGRSITDTSGEGVSIPTRGMSEPFFGHGNEGIWDRVLPGNEEYEKGDRLRKPQGGAGRGGASDSEDPLEDEFIFTLTKEEFIKYFFEDLELPDLIEKDLAAMEALKTKRAGYTNSGVATNMHIIKSMKGALGRRIALGSKNKKELDELEERLAYALLNEEFDEVAEIEAAMAVLKAKLLKIPFIDTFDLRYRNSVKIPAPDNRAVMFCLMDVSASMGENEKDIAKRFFMMLYLFLSKAYDKIELVFIRHHTSADEVTEHEFFNDRTSGGTLVSSGLALVDKVITERYPPSSWNIYIAQASDGDNFTVDNEKCSEIMIEKILPKAQYFAYIEITRTMTQELWDIYHAISVQNKALAIRQVMEISDIYPVFCDLFKKKGL